MKATFFLNTTPEFFASWLLHRTSEDRIQGELDFLIKEGRIVLHPAEWRPPISNVVEIQMFGTRTMRPSGGVQRCEGVPHMIRLVAVGLASDRVKVTAECREPAVTEYFEELLREIGKNWPEAKEGLEAVPKPAGQMARPLPSGFPKKGSTFDRYAEAYCVIIKYREEYRTLYDELREERPVPSIDEYRDALADRIGWRPSGRTVSTIIRLGDEGFLQDEYREMVNCPNR